MLPFVWFQQSEGGMQLILRKLRKYFLNQPIGKTKTILIFSALFPHFRLFPSAADDFLL